MPKAIELKLRPFDECFDRGSRLPPLHVKGEVLGEEFVVVIGRERVPLATLSVERDEQGGCARVPSGQRIPIGHQWLYLGVQALEGDAVGAELSLGVGMERGLMTAGAFTLFFDAEGRVEGQGIVRPASEPPTLN